MLWTPKRFSETLDQWLQPQLFRDHIHNGLLVDGGTDLQRVVTGVSFCDALVEAAVRSQAQGIVVHHAHGFWNNQPRLVVGGHGRRVRRLLEHGISLWGYHLPLDGQPEFGNNAQICAALGLTELQGFLIEGKAPVGRMGALTQPVDWEFFLQTVVAKVGMPQHLFAHGPKRVQRIAVCSGAAASALEDAASLGAQVFLTGEAREASPFQAQDLGMHFIACGHHVTEVFGPRALAKKIGQVLDLPAEFVDVANSV